MRLLCRRAEILQRGCNDLTHALNSADLSCLRPLAFTHMAFGVIYAESFHRDQDMTSFWLRIRQFLDDQTFNPPKPFKTIARIFMPPVPARELRLSTSNYRLMLREPQLWSRRLELSRLAFLSIAPNRRGCHLNTAP